MSAKRPSGDKGLAVFALLSIVVFVGGAIFLAMGVLDFVLHLGRASITEWVLFLPLVLYLVWKLLSPFRRYVQSRGWIPQRLTRRLNAAFAAQGQSPLGKFVVNVAMVCLVAAMLFQSFTLWIAFLALGYVGILTDLVWAFVTPNSRKSH